MRIGSLRVLLRDTMPFIRKVGGKMQVLRVLAATILGASGTPLPRLVLVAPPMALTRCMTR